MEKETNNLQREAKAYLDAMRAMTASQTRIAETLELFYTADKSSDVGAELLADVAGMGVLLTLFWYGNREQWQDMLIDLPWRN
jgi:hypothetical protein